MQSFTMVSSISWLWSTHFRILSKWRRNCGSSFCWLAGSDRNCLSVRCTRSCILVLKHKRCFLNWQRILTRGQSYFKFLFLYNYFLIMLDTVQPFSIFWFLKGYQFMKFRIFSSYYKLSKQPNKRQIVKTPASIRREKKGNVKRINAHVYFYDFNFQN